MSTRSRKLVTTYLALVQRDGFSGRLIGPAVGGHNTAERIGALLAATEDHVAEPLRRLSSAQDTLDRRVEEVETAAHSLNLSFDPRRIVTGLYPLGDLNAWTTPAAGGDLILMSSGAMGLVFLTLKINMMSAQMFGEPPILDRPQTLAALADVFAAHLRYGDPWRSAPLPPLTGHREVMLDLLVNASVRFAIGHEYGHIVAKHAPVGRTTLTSVDSKVEVHTRSVEDEFEADRLGAQLVLTEQWLAAAAETDPQFVRRHGLAAAAAATGPLYFLLLDLVLHELDGELKVVGYPPAPSGHPPSGQRWDALWPVIEQEYARATMPVPPLDLPGGLMRWFEHLFLDLVPAIAQRLETRG
ncbi:protein of unknown function [Actinokineospora alba]|uniref:Uncharacterized protein n=1 Tax=Actinokineospora alba TaxID=504798 RepID=A0A1H0I4W0_9PSEU|nr:ImmA/IrrE family metallo-endopeptidase [Actinokineospora alba]TDP64600.1 uncharacterized protein DUF955 [Actinokineospora alba]SDI86205.1 protein of unknown function [Actinokineospora alba]SDO26504.1 protein of unknown function [Actinokineospora alba]